jgi:aminopeptidase N
MVAARLERIEEHFVTRSGRTVRLQFFAEPGKLDQAVWALSSLKQAMAWDEEKYGLEIDLDEYNIVAVEDFNAGAMENKGLNVFNTKLVLARTDISTDFDFKFIDRTVAHEYFHNWTGNRVTCRDWFQLSLKEGLTVFREQQYAADRYSAAVERIQTVRNLRSFQFPEDAGPMAHPVRPQSYQKVSNFYTNTVYSKGAEVVRMIHTIIGDAAFRKGIDLYFERHDGQAVTTDDFVAAMETAAGIDLGQFRLWYEQAGTPRLTVTDHFDPATKCYELTITQSGSSTDGKPCTRPFQIPVEIGLLDHKGKALLLDLEGNATQASPSHVLLVNQATEVYRFQNISEQPVPSLLRNFSAPVIVDYDYADEALTLLLAADDDPFNRWDAGQRLALKLLLNAVADHRAGRDIHFPDTFTGAMARILDDAAEDPAFAAEVLVLPAEVYIGEQTTEIDPGAIHQARQALRRDLAVRLNAALAHAYEEFTTAGPYSPEAAAIGRRGLRNICLAYLMELADEETRHLCIRQLECADNMTDALSALTSLANCDCPERHEVLAAFYAKWQDEPMVVDKWLGVQAGSRLPGTVAAVRELSRQSVFDLKNPNKVYALIGSFAGNQLHFHAADGSGYAFVTEQVEALDRVNPQVAARIARNFERWRRYEPGRRTMMKEALERLAALPNLSKETGEVVGKALA